MHRAPETKAGFWSGSSAQQNRVLSCGPLMGSMFIRAPLVSSLSPLSRGCPQNRVAHLPGSPFIPPLELCPPSSLKINQKFECPDVSSTFLQWFVLRFLSWSWKHRRPHSFVYRAPNVHVLIPKVTSDPKFHSGCCCCTCMGAQNS